MTLSDPGKVSIERNRQFFLRNRFSEKLKGILCLLFSLLLIVLDHYFHRLDHVKFLMGSQTRPLQELLIHLLDKPYHTVSAFYNALDNEEKLEALSKALSEKKIQEQYLFSLEEKNNQLEKMLDLQKQHSDLKLITASVINVSINPLMTSLTINKGDSDHVLLAAPVISEKGLIGQVVRLYQHYAEVILLNDIHQATPVEILPGHIFGVAFGKNNNLVVKYLYDTKEISVHDQVVTSGLDGIYPKNLRIGTVSAINKVDGSNVDEVIVTPAAMREIPAYVDVISSSHTITFGPERFSIVKATYQKDTGD